MVQESGRGWQPGRAASLVGGALLLGGVFALTAVPGAAKDPPAKDKAKAETAKADAAKPAGPPVRPPEPIRLTIVAPGAHAKKTPSPKDLQELATTQEVVKTINQKLAEGWAKNKVVPSRYVDDHEFIRRASLDIIGRIAKPAEIQQFLRDPQATRRSLLIERLLASPEYARHWSDVWANWLLSRSGVFGRGQYHEQTAVWLEDQFALNKPYDQIVRELITAQGDNAKNGAVNFILAHLGERVPADNRQRDGEFEMVPITSRITRLFLGTQVQCAQCHDHPFYPTLKQDQFWGVNAFLRQVGREGTPPADRGRMMAFTKLTLRDNVAVNPDARILFEKRNGVIKETPAEFLPSGEERKGPRLPSGGASPGEPNYRRVKLAEYVTEHEQFPKAIVNRMWGAFFGRGFVNPVDDFNEQNQPSNPELLNDLASRLKHYGYDLKMLIRWVCNSNAYNLSCVANRTNDKPEQEALFGRMVLKSMSPEQLFESLMVATNAEANETKEGKKALREKWMNRLISNFGDDEGNEVNFNGTVVQALLMMNGDDINTAIDYKKGTVARAVGKHPSPGPVIGELYLAALNRRPTPLEVKTIEGKLPMRMREKDPTAPYADVFWALLNSNEFLLNH